MAAGSRQGGAGIMTPLLKRILDAGKSINVYARAEEVAPLVGALGARGVLSIITDATHEDMARLCDS